MLKLWYIQKEIDVMFGFLTLVAYTIYGEAATCNIWVKSLTLPLSW